MIRCSLLGPVDVSVDGAAAPPELLWHKNLALLVYLACSPKRTRSRDHLIGLLWGDKPEEKARRSLNQALYTIRSVGGQEAVVTTAQQVKLVDGAVTLDIDAFLAHAAAGEWDKAADFVQGAFLEGFSLEEASGFEDWLAAERGTWSTRGVEALCHHAGLLIDSGRLSEASVAARRALALDPHSEPALRTLLRALALAEDQSGALRAFAEFTQRLRADLGSEPGPDLLALADRVRQERQWRTQAQVPRAGRESRRLPLVGRGGPLTRLLAAWGGCRAESRASLVAITGGPGAGKSRLADEVAVRARLDGAAGAAIRAVASDQETPWSGVLGLARGGLLDTTGLAAAPPAALGYFAAELLEWKERFPGATRETPLRADRAFIEVLEAATGEQPIVLFVDDAQWLDRDTTLCLEAALRDLAGAPLFVLLVVPPQPAQLAVDPLLARIGREIPGSVVHLEALTSADIRELARALFPKFSEGELERLARRIALDSAGLPLLAVELLHAVALGLDLDKSKSAWPEPGRTFDETLPSELPEAILGAVRVGFRRLSANAQLVLQAAAVLGDRVPAAQLGRATGLAAAALTAALDELEWQRWLVAEPRGYSFLARIIGEIVSRDLTTPGHRQRLRDAGGAT